MIPAPRLPLGSRPSVQDGKILTAIISRVAGGLTVAGLVALAAGCSSSAASVPVPVANGSSSSAPAVGRSSPAPPPNPQCQQKYTAWRLGPSRGLGQHLQADLPAFEKAANANDDQGARAALKKLGDDAAIEQYPIPACADPHGYYMQMLADMKDSGDAAAVGSGLTVIFAPLQKALALQSKVKAELKAEQLQ